MAGGAGSLKVAAAGGCATGLGAGGAASDYFTGDYYLVSTNLLLEADVSSFIIPTDA
jgi:hypothetical protein